MLSDFKVNGYVNHKRTHTFGTFVCLYFICRSVGANVCKKICFFVLFCFAYQLVKTNKQIKSKHKKYFTKRSSLLFKNLFIWQTQKKCSGWNEKYYLRLHKLRDGEKEMDVFNSRIRFWNNVVDHFVAFQ